MQTFKMPRTKKEPLRLPDPNKIFCLRARKSFFFPDPNLAAQAKRKELVVRRKCGTRFHCYACFVSHEILSYM